MPILYQPKPRDRSTYTRHKNRSYTDSRQSYQNGASKKFSILRWNGRLPTMTVVWHLFRVLSPKEIKELRKKVFRYLKEHGIIAVVSIELTRGADWKPNDTVHFHFLIDTQCSIEEIRELFNTACERQGLIRGEDFRIDCYQRDEYDYTVFYYFTKFGKKYFYNVILFKKGLGLDKFYTIGKWFYKPQVQIWEEIKAFMREKYGTDIEKTACSDAPDSNNGIDTPSINNELPSEPVQEEYSVAALCDDLIDDYMCEWSLNALNFAGATRRTHNIRRNPDDIPTKTSIDFDRRFMREWYGIDIDEVTGGNEAITRLFVLSAGKFRKYPEGGWYCMNEFVLPSKPVQRARADSDKGITRVPARNERPQDCYSLLPCREYKDRRYEWQRYRYSIAFLN